MTRRYAEDDDWNDDPIDEDAMGDEEDDVTVACPYCRQQIYEDVSRCPHCEQYISQEDSPPARKPWLIVLGVVLCLYVVYRWTFG